MPTPPEKMRVEDRWVCHNKKKVPLKSDGSYASTTDPSTWCSYETALDAHLNGIGTGLGFNLGEGFCGIDLDDCRDPDTGEFEPWAQDILDAVKSYREVSPSQCGVKIFCLGKLPGPAFKNGKVEFYEGGRYFTYTGQDLDGYDIVEVDLTEVYNKYVRKAENYDERKTINNLTRCREKLTEIPDSVSGDAGHDKCLRAACEILRFGIDGPEGLQLLREYNDTKCYPPWSERELAHKWRSAHTKVMRSGEFAKHAKARPKFTWINDDEFCSTVYETKYLVDGMLAAGQHFLIGAPAKSLKTSIAIDLHLSLASGAPFLGAFDVPEAVPVAFVSGESGPGPLQDTRMRVANSRGIPWTGDNFWWCFDVPQLSIDEHMEILEEMIQERGIQLCTVDPAYLAILEKGHSGSSSDIFTMGGVLKRFGEISQKTGCTMSLIHHLVKSANARKPSDYLVKPMLNDFSQSGFAEYCRQWLLLKPRLPYCAGTHKLWMIYGGSAGHSGEYILDVEEGVPDDIAGRRWEISLTDPSTVGVGLAFDAAEYEAKKIQVVTALDAHPAGLTLRKIRETVPKLRQDHAEAILGQLVELGHAEAAVKKIRGRERIVYKPKGE